MKTIHDFRQAKKPLRGYKLWQVSLHFIGGERTNKTWQREFYIPITKTAKPRTELSETILACDNDKLFNGWYFVHTKDYVTAIALKYARDVATGPVGVKMNRERVNDEGTVWNWEVTPVLTVYFYNEADAVAFRMHMDDLMKTVADFAKTLPENTPVFSVEFHEGYFDVTQFMNPKHCQTLLSDVVIGVEEIVLGWYTIGSWDKKLGMGSFLVRKVREICVGPVAVIVQAFPARDNNGTIYTMNLFYWPGVYEEADAVMCRMYAEGLV